MSDIPVVRARVPDAPLELAARTWPLFGRSLLVVIGQMLIVPSPWTTTAFYRWFVVNIRLPGGPQVFFTGQPGDIWYIFILSGLIGYAGAYSFWFQLAMIPVNTLLYLVIMRWFFRNLIWDGRREPLRFAGSYWGLLGWTLLTWLLTLTIIGWAWAATAMTRWVCRNIEGTRRTLTFAASGWSLLWRTFVFALCAIFIIPIPWIGRWYLAWAISQFRLSAPVSGTAAS